MRQKKKIVILSGGFSEEKEVSKVSAYEIEKALKTRNFDTTLIDPSDFDSYCEMISKIKEIDPFIAFNGLHGAEGENGRIQSLLSLNKILYTGSDYKASAVSMDKYLSGILADSIGIPVPDRVLINKQNSFSKENIVEKIGFPMVIKPNDSGSSVGITIINGNRNLSDAIKLAFKYSNAVICENYIKGRELTVAILDDKPLPVVEIKPVNGWYDYTSKYSEGHTNYEVPAKLSEKETLSIQEYAINIFKFLGCKVYARVDFRYDSKTFYFLEVNTLPGMTPLSLTPMAAREDGYEFDELLLKIIECSLKR